MHNQLGSNFFRKELGKAAKVKKDYQSSDVTIIFLQFETERGEKKLLKFWNMLTAANKFRLYMHQNLPRFQSVSVPKSWVGICTKQCWTERH